MGSRRSDPPAVAPALRSTLGLGKEQVGLLSTASKRAASDPYFGLDFNVGADTAQRAAQVAALRTFGGQGFADIENYLRNVATGGLYEDVTGARRALANREFSLMDADLRERLGRTGNRFSTGFVDSLTRERGRIGESLILADANDRFRAAQAALSAGQLYGELGRVGAGVLGQTGDALRKIALDNIMRKYAALRFANFDAPALAASAAGGLMQATPLYQPTYGPGGFASALGVVAPIAGAALGGPLGAALAGAITPGVTAAEAVKNYG